MTATSGRIVGKRLAQLLSAREYSVSRVFSKGKPVPPPPPPAYGRGSNPGTRTTPVKPGSKPSTPAPSKEAPKAPSGAGDAPPKKLDAAASSAVKLEPPAPQPKQPPAVPKQQPPAAPPTPAAAKEPVTSTPSAKPAPRAPAEPTAVSKLPSQTPTTTPPQTTEASPKQQQTLVAPNAPPQQSAKAPEAQPKASTTETVKVTGPQPPPGASAGGVGRDRAKQAYFTGGTGIKGSGDAQKPPQGNAWLLSKSLPVDVRLLAAGAASIGAIYYYNSREQKPAQSSQPSKGEGNGGDSPGTFPGNGEEYAEDKQHPQAPDFGGESMGQAAENTDEGSVQTASSDTHSDAGSFYTEELAMQSRDAFEGVPEQETAPEPAPAAEKQTQAAEPVVLPPPEPSALKKAFQNDLTNAAKAVERSIQDGQPLEVVDTKPVTDLLNEVGTGVWQLPESPGEAGGEQLVDAAHAEMDALKGAIAQKESGEGNIEELAGVADDISADALLKKAVERAESEGRDWAIKHENLMQARADEQTIREILKKAYAYQQAKVAAAMAVAEANARRAEDIQAAAEAAQERFAQILDDTLAVSYAQHDQDMLRQAEFLANAAAEAAVRERSERAGALDELRFKVNALGQAFTRRSDEQRDSMRAHQISLGAFALQNALAHGKPYADAASLLAQTCAKEDEVVAAALQALPQDSASRGIPTQAELLERAPTVAQNARQMAYIKPGSGGVLSLGLARLAASLKVPEGTNGAEEGIDGALARMQSHLAAGRLVEAADALEAGTRGTAAEKAASEWARDARARALADQTTSLLQAHACSLAVSQS